MFLRGVSMKLTKEDTLIFTILHYKQYDRRNLKEPWRVNADFRKMLCVRDLLQKRDLAPKPRLLCQMYSRQVQSQTTKDRSYWKVKNVSLQEEFSLEMQHQLLILNRTLNLIKATEITFHLSLYLYSQPLVLINSISK